MEEGWDVKEETVEEADDMEMDMGMDTEMPADDTLAPTSTDEIDIDPKVKAIQDSLSKALANAKALGDEKLVNQIGNTITMLVRTQVVGQQQVTEMQDEEYTDLLSMLQDYVSADYTADQGYGDGVVEKAEADKERIEAEVTRMKGAEYFKVLKEFANLVTYDDEYAGAEESAEIQPLLAELAEKLGFTVDQLKGL